MKLLIGGSPCTHWSIAQTKNRETTAEGIGWELFRNYVIALEKYRPDYFLYENNKSMSKAIRESITQTFGFEPVCINSALVSAQSRQRLYWVGKRNPDGTYSQVPVEQPEDRGILLRDILETGTAWQEKAYNLTTRCCGAIPSDTLKRHRHTMVAEPICVNSKSGCETKDPVCPDLSEQEFIPGETTQNEGLVFLGGFAKDGEKMWLNNGKVYSRNFRQGKRLYSADGKAVTMTAQSAGLVGHAGLYAVPINAEKNQTVAKAIDDIVERKGYLPEMFNPYNRAELSDKAPTLSTGSMVTSSCAVLIVDDAAIKSAVPCCMRYERSPEAKRLRKQYEAHEISHGYHEFSELHPRTDGKSNTLSTVLKDNPICEPVIEMDESGHYAISVADGKKYPVYEVLNGLITIKDKQYPIKLADGFYIIRKLTVRECMRLQTVPEEYVFPVSDSQAYKMLGNGWTVEVIAHIMSHFKGLTAEPVEVLSMYDGMSCGRLALNKLGVNVTTYYATEIDKYAIQATQHNFPKTVQLGDAFQVREEDWRL